jgi:hypothetical protein
MSPDIARPRLVPWNSDFVHDSTALRTRGITVAGDYSTRVTDLVPDDAADSFRIMIEQGSPLMKQALEAIDA